MAVAAIAAALPGILLEVLPAVLRDKGQNHGVPVAITDALVDDLAGKVADRLDENPVVRNATSSEKPWESRIAVGATTAAAGQAIALSPIGNAIDTLMPFAIGLINLFGADLQAPEPGAASKVLGAVATLWGVGYVFYGRFFSGGKKPLNPARHLKRFAKV